MRTTVSRYSEHDEIAEALRDLPARHIEPASDAASASTGGASGVTWARIDVDAYEVRQRGAVVGYIDVVGAVFVASAGARRDTAEERRQTLVFDTAVASLLQRAA
ncbi:hypothetical protein N3K63_02600 [Microbacterium sp. W1N]|uniref:hypothetical protein n=1 Tax=Microbacterium festucae TaxID=2977531 RepID=UPI0021C0909D|nr:hypothetical protein [Microbacterium festucae]MCT9819172.1 hypothetical protein [Microbacterium festucae]